MLDLRQVAEKLPTLDEFHEEVYPEFSLEHVLHVDQEWVVGLKKHIFFGCQVFDVVQLNNEILSD